MSKDLRRPACLRRLRSSAEIMRVSKSDLLTTVRKIVISIRDFNESNGKTRQICFEFCVKEVNLSILFLHF